MEQSRFYDDDSRSPDQEIPRLLWWTWRFITVLTRAYTEPGESNPYPQNLSLRPF
jgi:hypothetical protein